MEIQKAIIYNLSFAITFKPNLLGFRLYLKNSFCIMYSSLD